MIKRELLYRLRCAYLAGGRLAETWSFPFSLYLILYIGPITRLLFCFIYYRMEIVLDIQLVHIIQRS